jgi:hypothetical protein
MKSVIKTMSAGRRLGLVTSIIALLGGFSANAATLLIVNETYDPPWLPLAGWDGGAVSISREYVSEGVGGSTAVQMSADLVDPGAYVATTLFQSGVMGGNDWATRANTVLSFDIKIDRPGMLSVSMDLESLSGYDWTADQATSSVGTIPLGSYTPGVFKRIVVPLNDPLWVRNPSSTPPFLPLFEPSGRTYNQIALQVDSGSLPHLGQFTVTIDNLQVSTKNAMIPFTGTTSGEYTFTSDGIVLTEHGYAAHVGSFELNCTVPYDFSPCSVELTAANGDKLLGSFVFGAYAAYDYGVQIENGTGRFKGAVGSYRGSVTFDPTLPAYTATLLGSITTVGSNKN